MYHVSSSLLLLYLCRLFSKVEKGEEQLSHSLVLNFCSIPSFPVFLITSDPWMFKSWDLFSSSSFSHLLPSENSTWCFPSAFFELWLASAAGLDTGRQVGRKKIIVKKVAL